MSSVISSKSSSSVSAAAGSSTPSTQDIAYSTYTPNSYDKPLAEYWAKAGSAIQTQDESDEDKRVRVEFMHDGIAVGVEQGGGVKWKRDLGSIG